MKMKEKETQDNWEAEYINESNRTNNLQKLLSQ